MTSDRQPEPASKPAQERVDGAASPEKADHSQQPLSTRATDSSLAGGCRILVIDDHADTVEAMSRLIERLGFRVTSAASLSTAHEVLASHDGEPFALVLADIGLPDGSGLGIPALLREVFPDRHVPALALSGYGMERDVAASLAAGFCEHVVKPITLQQLRDTIERTLGPLPQVDLLP